MKVCTITKGVIASVALLMSLSVLAQEKVYRWYNNGEHTMKATLGEIPEEYNFNIFSYTYGDDLAIMSEGMLNCRTRKFIVYKTVFLTVEPPRIFRENSKVSGGKVPKKMYQAICATE